MLPFEIFGLKIPFGMELNFTDNPNNPFKLIYESDLPNSKVKNLQDFLKPSLKKYKGTGSNGVGSPISLADLKNQTSEPIIDNSYPGEIINIKYSTGTYINGVNYNYVYINQDTEKLSAQVNNLETNGQTPLAIEKLRDAIKDDPSNQSLIDKLKDLLKIGLTDNSQPILKMMLGLVTLPIKILAGIIQYIMDFFKSLTNPLTLPTKMIEFLSFSWLMEFFTPKGLLGLAGIKFNPTLISDWISSPKEMNLDPADLSEFFSAPFLPKLPTYNIKQIKTNPELPFRQFWPFMCLIEKIINGIIDFIWSTLGLEAILKAPHIKLCSKAKEPGLIEATDLMKVLNGESPGGSNIGSVDNIDDLFVYDITLDDGTIIKGLNYEDMEKFISDNKDLGYDFKF